MKSLTKKRAKFDITSLVYVEKTCKGCNRAKPLNEFPTKAKSPDGHGPKCKNCNVSYKKPRPLPKGSRSKICQCCERKLEKTSFSKLEWRDDGYDSTCKSCRTTLRLEKGISRWVHEYDLTPEERVAARLLAETRTNARAMAVMHILDWGWFLDHIEAWRCEETGKPLGLRRRGGRAPAFEATVKLKHPRRGYIPTNCKIVAR